MSTGRCPCRARRPTTREHSADRSFPLKASYGIPAVGMPFFKYRQSV
jgi:hypothetical protein